MANTYKTDELKALSDAAKSSASDVPVGGICKCCTDAMLMTPTALGSCQSTTAQYSIGPPKRPAIFQDNGFLQNPSNPQDPNPIPTTEPTLDDLVSLTKWKSLLEVAEAGQGVPYVPHNNIPDGLAAYRHFLEGKGADRRFSYDRFVDNDPSGAVILKNSIRDIQLCAEKFYRHMVANDPSIATSRVKFQLTGTAIAAREQDVMYPYPRTENWQKAIGAHFIWMSGTVEVEPAPCSGDVEPKLKMRATLQAEDKYNFNPGATDIATGTPDAENGRFERTGLAHQYTNYATLQRDVTWMLGHPGAGVTLKTDDSRQRKPADNERARNRL